MSDDNRPLRPGADAVLLHTIVDCDIYGAQEQEDGDFALALSLEDEEQDRARENSRLSAQAQDREALIAHERERDTPPPYRDDIAAEDTGIHDDDDLPPFCDGDGGEHELPPYRNDPDAVVEEEEGRVEVSCYRGRLHSLVLHIYIASLLHSYPINSVLHVSVRHLAAFGITP